MSRNGKLLVIGFGPGSFEHITDRARAAIQESDVIIGYNTYVDLISGLLTDQAIVRTGMTEEVSRAREAVRQAELGKKVAVISSGDAGVYGMAGLVYEVLIEKGWTEATGVEIEIIPGISAINSCSSLLGAPVMHDACTISLSDHLTPWAVIAKRVEAAASADFVIALYNPRSGRRTRQIVETQRILLKYRSAETPVGLVKSAYRDREHVVITTLGDMLDHDIGMLTTVIIGNSSTFFYDGKIITPRGYQRKYTLNSDVQTLKPHERLRTEAEPWSLNAQEEWVENEEEEEVEKEKVSSLGAAELANEALQLFQSKALVSGGPNVLPQAAEVHSKTPSIFEVGVSPGIANKKFTAKQMGLLAELAGDDGELEYTPQHQVLLRVPTDDAETIVTRLKEHQLLVFAIGDIVQVKACDFCNLEKDEAIPVAEELHMRFGGIEAPKELKIGLNGCGMACYGAVMEDIGIVYRKGGYDLFLGGKQIGRNAHAGQNVVEGIPADRIVETVEQVVKEFTEKGHPGERFHKFFKRVGQVAGFTHTEYIAPVIVDAVCGD
ncbi:precorrin-3B C(17)-methyltransferase [Paenibacillus alkaliterrae]|uniref:precorrin-3B C(17)-methyltransferase n=1 Tax=Paenibacillus alkaliterrae TaxID=320909 RepID=UPI001F3E39A4|nr:precorrin-3B C(17)-methyltransferase [Paenibacillus alkaliterrae]MCF2940179.1 precorrin-3B C(17)-methyltransferase [Paenibacillus alkaliterrae]